MDKIDIAQEFNAFNKELNGFAQKHNELCEKLFQNFNIPQEVFNVPAKGNAPTRLCQVSGCGKKHHAKGFCKYHYEKAKTKPAENSVPVVIPQETQIVELPQNDEPITKVAIESEGNLMNFKRVQKAEEPTKTILEEKEENLTEMQKKDLEEHRAAIKHREELEKMSPIERLAAENVKYKHL